MTKTYKYSLQKGSKKHICPNCERKSFVYYAHTSDMRVIFSEKHGRCERINSCGYHMYPRSSSDFDDWKPNFEPPKAKIIAPDFVPLEIVESTFNMYHTNTFFMYLTKLFDLHIAHELQERYNIGTAKGNGTIYWQQDKDNKFRTGKVMYYGTNGNRLKDRSSWYVHKNIKKDYELHQVFFGEHLLNDDEYKNKPIALCESEKSAVIMSQFMPEYLWLASGGANMLNDYRLMRLPRLDMVYPDNGQYELWENKTKLFGSRKMDISVDNAVRDGIIEVGDDILDLWMNEKMIKMKTECE